MLGSCTTSVVVLVWEGGPKWKLQAAATLSRSSVLLRGRCLHSRDLSFIPHFTDLLVTLDKAYHCLKVRRDNSAN